MNGRLSSDWSQLVNTPMWGSCTLIYQTKKLPF
jgi:hypothetical protein